MGVPRCDEKNSIASERPRMRDGGKARGSDCRMTGGIRAGAPASIRKSLRAKPPAEGAALRRRFDAAESDGGTAKEPGESAR